MTTYRELKAQIDVLQRKAEEVRKGEIAELVADIKAKIAEYDLEPNDIFPELRSTSFGSRSRGFRKEREIKYRHPQTGEVWSGGPGRKPIWVRNVEESGENIEQYSLKK